MKTLPENFRQVLFLASRVFVGFVFAYAGFAKLTEPIENLHGAMAQYQVIPYAWIPFISSILPWAEFLTGVFLILGYAPKIFSACAAFLCFSFLLVLGSSDALLNPSVHCGCFGQNGIQMTAQQMFILDMVNLVLSLRLYTLPTHPWSLDSFLKKS